MSLPVTAGLFGLQTAILSFAVGFTVSGSVIRPAGLLATLLCTYYALPYAQGIDHSVLRAFLGSAIVYLNILYMDVVLLHQWTFEAKGPISSQGGLVPDQYRVLKSHHTVNEQSRRWERIQFGYTTSLQSRFPGTKWPVKNIPPFARSNAGYTPSKASFLYTTTIKWILCILLIDCIDTFKTGADENAITFFSEKIPFLTRLSAVSAEELTARVLSTFGYWAASYVVLEAVYSTLGIVAVLFGDATDIRKWPPMFGSIQDCYSLRQFWGTFWHQLIRRGCSSIAHFITYSTLNLRKGGIMGRYLFIFLTFVVSGVFHFLADIMMTIPWQESGAMYFFCIQTLGIILEDGVQAIYQSRGKGCTTTGVPRFWVRFLGYVWVIVWLSWSTPVWTYPTMQRDDGSRILDFSLLGLVAGLWK
ncbi:hypothetical protein BO71DRAFT_483561 [Aspergillus ellipticus CBS 707.79]|uniref:Wax synthase domain-containing protein n=1 Tax=Aspergillus ellipticus CBS 707.79 TaxID=1448320 RepID=A0A319DKW0_9EURO|nr:hypothetical protein BO71DRAFT_483561 [Aspergillus ellipticus CBS 707.79]